MSQAVRPTKKQRELLDYIETFIAGHGYSPSYREIMNGLHYNSVATVALHIGNLIKRGHLRKRDHSARSLEVVRGAVDEIQADEADDEYHEAWLMGRVEAYLAEDKRKKAARIGGMSDETRMLLGALELLGLARQADELRTRVGRRGIALAD